MIVLTEDERERVERARCRDEPALLHIVVRQIVTERLEAAHCSEA